ACYCAPPSLSYRSPLHDALPISPDSIRPSAIASATCTAEARPVPQACCRSNAGVEASRMEPITVSRVRLKSRECLSTAPATTMRSEEHTSELQSRFDLVCRLLLE